MSCCSCGNNCSPGCGCLYMVIPGDPSGSYSLMNVNTLGVGVADGQDGTQFNFRGVASANNSIIVTYDAGSHAIMLTLDIDEIINDLPDATTTQRGVLETATDAESIAKVAVDKILTPSNLAALGSSTTFAGFIEIATQAEVNAGVINTMAVTPLTMVTYLSTQINLVASWFDDAARAAVQPNGVGQFGGQTNDGTGYVSDGVAAGDWRQILTDDNDFVQTGDITIIGNTVVSWFFQDTNVDFTGAVVTFNNESIQIENSVVNFNALTILQDNGVTVPASSVLTTSATAGQFNSLLISTFLSNSNTQVYGNPSGTLARTTFASYAGQNISNPPTEAEVQALDDAVVIVSQRLAALITDLRATLKPHAT